MRRSPHAPVGRGQVFAVFLSMLPFPLLSLSPSFWQGIRVDHAKHEGSLHKSLIANELFTPHASERKLSMRDRFVNR
jgi:hypothetical protein